MAFSWANGDRKAQEEAKSKDKQKRMGGEERHDLGTKYPKWLYSK